MNMEKELKTLKDLKWDGSGNRIFPDICIKKLKAEAVKRAKYHLKRRDKFFKLDGKNGHWFYWNGRLHEVMEANNLTSEDLK